MREQGAGLRAIATNKDESIDTALVQNAYRLQLRLVGFEFRVSLAAWYRAAMLDDSANVPNAQGKKVIASETGIAVTEAKGFPPLINCSTDGKPLC